MLFPQHHLLILSLTRKASRWCPETKPRLWVLGAPQRPLRSRPRTGGRGGKLGGGRDGGKGRSAAPAPALLSYCATASAPRPGSTPQRALGTCWWPRGQSWTPGSLPHPTPPPPRARESQRTVTTRAERTPDAPGQHRPHVAVIPEAPQPSTP